MSVLADFQVNGANPSIVGGLGNNVEKYFPRLLGTSIGVQSVAPSAASAAGQLVVPAFNELNGQRFKVVLAGDVLDFTGGTTFSVNLSANTGTVASPVYTIIATTGAVGAANTARFAFAMEINLFGTTASGLVGGWYNSTTVAPATGTSTVKAQGPTSAFPIVTNDFTKGQAIPGAGIVFGLVASVNFATSVAQNSASLYQFQVIAD